MLPALPVIIRVGSGHVPQRHMGFVHETIRERLPEVLRQEGVVACHVGRKADATGESMIIVTVWQDMRSLYAWVGGDLRRLVLIQGIDDRFDRFDLTLFESLVDLPVPEAGAS